MPSSHAAFSIDPSINFDNFSFDHHNDQNSRKVSNFSRPMSIRPALSHNDFRSSFHLPELSRPSSFGSSRDSVPRTPGLELEDPMLRYLAGSVVVQPEHHSYSDAAGSTFMVDLSKLPKLDLTFSIESAIACEINAPSPPPQLLERLSTRDRNSRPTTAAYISGADIRPAVSEKDADIEAPNSASPTVTSFADFRKGLAQRQEEARRAEAGNAPPLSPTFQFLQQDPFRFSSKATVARSRPQSAGTALADGCDGPEVDEAFPAEKRGTPSIMSSRSTRSIRKGFLRVKRILLRTRKE